MAKTTSERVSLKTLLDTYGHTKGLKDGSLTSSRLRLEFDEIRPVSSAFGRMAETQDFDFSEMAIVTFMQALSLDKPLVLLPAVMLNRFHHGSIISSVGGSIKGPADLDGKRIGVRAYTQTTGVWVRGIFHAEYGLDLDGITNVTTEGGHLSEYVEPANVVRAPKGAKLRDMLVAGEIDAWIAGRDAPAVPEFRPVLENADAASLEWFDRLKAFPINHMVTLSRAVVDRHPWLPAELFELLKRGKEQYVDELRNKRDVTEPDELFRQNLLRSGIDPLPFGVEALRRSLEVVTDYAFAQKLIPKKFAVDDLFDSRTRSLA
jgi:4,5-dihydroxyphthalate decarboxylase